MSFSSQGVIESPHTGSHITDWLNDRGMSYVLLADGSIVVFDQEAARLACLWDESMIVYINRDRYSCR